MKRSIGYVHITQRQVESLLFSAKQKAYIVIVKSVPES